MWLQIVTAAVLVIPAGLDLYMPVPEGNRVTHDKVVLGRQLFFDRRLSLDQSISCATCHRPDRSFSDGRPVAVGVMGRVGRRNAPALINRGYGRAFFWDGRSPSLEAQVTAPIADPNEMGFSLDGASARVGLSGDQIAFALASYVRSILSGNSRFDRFVSGARDALTPVEQQGLQIFRGKGNCTACHVGPTFTDERTHNTGVAWRTGTLTDAGSGGGAFKTPTLREVARTAPYMHDGRLATLSDVVNFYEQGGHPNPNLDAEVRPFRATPDEKRSLVAFLETLTGELQEGGRSSVLTVP